MLLTYILCLCFVLSLHTPVMLCSTGQDDHQMIEAAKNGETETVIQLIREKGVQLNTRNNNGVTALIFAANNGHYNLVKELLDVGASIEDKSNNGMTSLNWACKWGHFDVAALLVARGADIATSDIEGMTPLMWASKSRSEPLVKLLLKNGAQSATKNIYNGTALSIAKVIGASELIALLEPLTPTEEDPSPFDILAQMLYDGACRGLRLVEAGLWDAGGRFLSRYYWGTPLDDFLTPVLWEGSHYLETKASLL